MLEKEEGFNIEHFLDIIQSMKENSEKVIPAKKEVISKDSDKVLEKKATLFLPVNTENFKAFNTDKFYRLEFLLPEFKKNEFIIKFDGKILEVKSDINIKETYWKKKFSYKLNMPSDINKSLSSATLNDGILMINFLRMTEETYTLNNYIRIK
jgi:HSP20 family molecular chaperone IbpA